MTTITVEARDLGKLFRIYRRPFDRLLMPGTARMKKHWALRHIDLTVPQGRCLGVIGVNGSGKSTLLKLLTGVIRPTEGSLSIASPPLALLELGTGFNGELSGRENLFTTGALLGYSADAIAARLSEIRDFADIGDYFDQPMKTYSSGMFVRVAFALYVSLQSEVLIVDEALSVGDFFFQQKCAAALRAIKQRGTTILFVSHDTAAVQEMADEAILLNQGQIVARGDATTVISRYHVASNELSARFDRLADTELAEQYGIDDEALRRRISEICAGNIIAGKPTIGVGGARIVALRILDHARRPSLTFQSGTSAYFEIVIEALHTMVFPNWGMLIADDQDRTVWAAANSNQGLLFGSMRAGDRIAISLQIEVSLRPGAYFLNFTAGEFDPEDPAYAVRHDVRLRAVTLRVTPGYPQNEIVGLASLPMQIAAL